ncbi:MAG: class II aldolase/adducin family protein [Alphaproteobacteria bacterium]|nr:class II aldolase/adducin family protein [Alphaproteobacteria bacterium]
MKKPVAANVRTKRRSLKGIIHRREWETRVDLAACFRACDLLGIYERRSTVGAAIAARVPGAADQLLINPRGVSFDEITASNLLKIDRQGKKLDNNPLPTPGAYVLHATVFDRRRDVNCVLHHHSQATMAVASLTHGLLPVNQPAIQWLDRIAYLDFDGFEFGESELANLARAFGDDNKIVFMRNHGVLVGGEDIAEAFAITDDLEKACRAQLLAEATGTDLATPPIEVLARATRQFEKFRADTNRKDWQAMRRWLDRQKVRYAV